MSTMNGFAMLRFEFIIHNQRHRPIFESWVATNLGLRPLRFTPRRCMFGLIEEYHSISTLPTSHYKYNEWLEDVEIGVWALKWSWQRGFQSWEGLKLKLACLHSTFDIKIQ